MMTNILDKIGAYKLEEIAQHYKLYCKLMKHWDQVLPGKVYSLDYESLASSPEDEIKKLLAYCELDFEPACLSPESNTSAVKTASSAQVRQAIHTNNLEYWKNFQQQLEPVEKILSGLM